MNVASFTELYEEYIEIRKINITETQFSAFLTYYPALLMAKTDGEVDEHEWSLLQSLAEHLVSETVAPDADKEELKDYKHLFFNEFQYLMDNLDRWDRPFMRVLQKMLAQQPQLAESAAAVIYVLADVSKGICEKEKTMIEYLRNELRIKDFCMNISLHQPTSKVEKQPKWHEFLATFFIGL